MLFSACVCGEHTLHTHTHTHLVWPRPLPKSSCLGDLPQSSVFMGVFDLQPLTPQRGVTSGQVCENGGREGERDEGLERGGSSEARRDRRREKGGKDEVRRGGVVGTFASLQ